MISQQRSGLGTRIERFFTHPLRPAVVGFASVIFALVARYTQNFTSGPILCTFRLITDLPCPFCGTTRAFGSLTQGQLLESLTLNPLAFIITFIFALWVFRPEITQKISDQFVHFWWRMSEIGRIKTSIMIFALLWVANLPRMLNA